MLDGGCTLVGVRDQEQGRISERSDVASGDAGVGHEGEAQAQSVSKPL